jgi:hypothetical protein
VVESTALSILAIAAILGFYRGVLPSETPDLARIERAFNGHPSPSRRAMTSPVIPNFPIAEPGEMDHVVWIRTGQPAGAEAVMAGFDPEDRSLPYAIIVGDPESSTRAMYCCGNARIR